MPLLYSDWITKQQKSPLTFVAFCGEEKTFIEEALHWIRAQILKGPFTELNHTKRSAKNLTLPMLLDEAQQIPMMAQKRLMEIHEAHTLDSQQGELLEKYLQNPSESACLILIFDTVDMRQKIPKILEQAGVLYRFDHPKPYEMPKIIEKRAQALGLQLSPEATQLLGILVGNEMGFLQNALSKLDLACDSKNIHITDIETHVAGFGLEDAFLLGKALMLKDAKKAFQVLRNLQHCKEIPLKILGLIAWHIRQLLHVKIALLSKQTESQMSQSLGLFGDRLKLFVQAAQKTHLTHIKSCITELAIADNKLKLTSSALGWLYLEELISKITTTKNP